MYSDTMNNPVGSTSNTEDDDDWETASFDDALSHAVQAVESMKLSEAQQQQQKQQAARAARAHAGKGSTATSQSHQAGPVLPFDGAHILELCDLTTAHDTAFLEELASSLDCEITPNIKWVDEHHALLLFSDPAAVRTALKAWPPGLMVRARSFLEATPGSKALPVEALQPAKRRPKTTTAVARRLIGNALSMQLRDRDAEQQLAIERKEKAQARRAARLPRADAAFDS